MKINEKYQTNQHIKYVCRLKKKKQYVNCKSVLIVEAAHLKLIQANFRSSSAHSSSGSEECCWNPEFLEGKSTLRLKINRELRHLWRFYCFTAAVILPNDRAYKNRSEHNYLNVKVGGILHKEILMWTEGEGRGTSYFLLDRRILEAKTFHVKLDVSVRWRGCLSLCQLNPRVSLVSEGVSVCAGAAGVKE